MSGTPTKSTENSTEDNDALSALAAMGMGTLEDLASMVDGGDNAAIDEEEEEREFQQLMAMRKAGGTVPHADADALREDDLIDELDDDDDETEKRPLPYVVKATATAATQPQQQQPAIAETPSDSRKIGPQFTIQPNHISAHRKNGTAVLRFTELFAPLSYKPVGVDPFVKARTRERPLLSLRRTGIAGVDAEWEEEEEYDEENDEDRDTRFFEREQWVISQKEMERLKEVVHFHHRKFQYIQSEVFDDGTMHGVALEELEEGDVDTETEDERAAEQRKLDQQREMLSERTDKPLIEQDAWEDCIVWDRSIVTDGFTVPTHGPHPAERGAQTAEPRHDIHQKVDSLELHQHLRTPADLLQGVQNGMSHASRSDATPLQLSVDVRQQSRDVVTVRLEEKNKTITSDRWGVSEVKPDASSKGYGQMKHRHDVTEEELENVLQSDQDLLRASNAAIASEVESGEIPTKKPARDSGDEPVKESFYQRKMRRRRMKLMREAEQEQEELGRRHPQQVMDFMRKWTSKEKDTLEDRRDHRIRGLIINEQLMSDKWMNTIIWDTDRPPKEQPDTGLIINPGDRYMTLVPVVTKEQRRAMEQARIRREEELNPLFRGAPHPNIYNLSNDPSYEDVDVSIVGALAEQQKRTMIVTHALPAQMLDPEYYLLHIPRHEIRRLHRPRYPFIPGSNCIIKRKLQKTAKSRTKPREMDKKKSLSAFNHHVILVEHAEQTPAVLCNRGMGTNVVNYYMKTGDEKAPPRPQDGRTVLVQSQDEMPVMGQLRKGEFVTALENTLYSAQIHRHDPSPTDFMLCTRKTPTGITFYIREIPVLYSAGHTQPRIEVPQLGSRMYNNYIKNRIAQYIYRVFLRERDAGNHMTITWNELKGDFKSMPDTSLRKALKDLAVFKRRGPFSGFWLPKEDAEIPGEHELKPLVTPEMVCMFESMLQGNLRLEDRNVDATVSMAAYILSSIDLGNRERLKRTIRFIERERNLTPWSKCVNMSRAIDVKEGADIALLDVAVQNLNKMQMDALNKTIEDAIAEFVKRALAQANEQGDTLANMTNEQAKRILLERGKFSETFTNRMTLADRKLMAIKVLRGEITSEEDAGQQLSARELVRRSKFRDVLRFVFAIEAEKLRRGFPYYGRVQAPTVTHVEEYDTSLDQTMMEMEGSEEMQDMEDEMQMDRMLEEMITEDTGGDFSMDQGEEQIAAELERILEEDAEDQLFDKQPQVEYKQAHARTAIHDYAAQQQVLAYDAVSSPAQETGIPPSPSPTPDQSQIPGKSRRRLVVKRTVKMTLPDGSQETKVEYIRDPELVNYYVRRKRAEESGEGKRGKFALPSETDERFRAAMKERRKLQDLFRRWKRNRSEEYIRKKRHKQEKRRAESEAKRQRAREQKEQAKKQKSQEPRKPRGRPRKTPLTPSSTTSTPTTEVKKRGRPRKSSLDSTGAPTKPVEQQKKRRKPNTITVTLPAAAMRRSGGGSGPSLIQLLRTVIGNAKTIPEASPFLWPVDPALYPDYNQVIAQPIDISIIEHKIENRQYSSVDQFMDDVNLLVNNAKQYCSGRYEPIVTMANHFLAHVKAELDKEMRSRQTAARNHLAEIGSNGENV